MQTVKIKFFQGYRYSKLSRLLKNYVRDALEVKELATTAHQSKMIYRIMSACLRQSNNVTVYQTRTKKSRSTEVVIQSFE